MLCELKSNKHDYKIGEVPHISVSITNLGKEDIYLIGSLDASDLQWRMPYCYYTIQKPIADSPNIYGRCGNMNPIRKEDFILVKSGQSFNPYQYIDDYGFFGEYETRSEKNFKYPGLYKIRFHYSTKSDSISKFLGDGKANNELNQLFAKVPKVELQSNEIELVFTR